MRRTWLAAGVRLAGVALAVWAGLAAPQARAWQPVLSADGSLALAAGAPVRPGETGIVGVVGFGTHPARGEVALTMQAMDAYLASTDGHRIPVDRLEWAFRRYPTDPLAFQPLQTGTVTVYRATGGWAGDLIWRFRPAWGDPAASTPYEVAIAYTMSPASVDHSPVAVLPDPYRLGSGESLDFYVYRPAAGLVSVAAWPQTRGPCSTTPGYDFGRVYPVQPGWNRLRWWPHEAGFPVFKTGLYCYAVSGNITGPMIGGGSFEVIDGSAAQSLHVAVTGQPDGHPVPGARVELGWPDRMPGRVAKTGSDGRASFAGIRPGRYLLSAHAAGYESVTMPLTVTGDAGADHLVRVHLQAAPSARLLVTIEPASGRSRPRVGDLVTVEVRAQLSAPGAFGRARVEVDMGPALAVLPGAWSTEPGGSGVRVDWQPPRLAWEWDPAGALDAPVMKAQAVVTPLAAGRSTLTIQARGWADAGGRRVSFEGAEARVETDPASSKATGLVIGAVRGLRDRSGAGEPLAVVAEDGTSVPVDRSGSFAMALPAGVHVLRVERAGPDGTAPGSWSAPVVLAVRPGAVVPVSLDAPGGSSPPAGLEPAVGLVAAGTIEWASGAPAGASGGVTLHAAGRSFEAVASVAASDEVLRLQSVALRAGQHLVLVGDVARRAGTRAETPRGRGATAAGSDVGERSPAHELSARAEGLAAGDGAPLGRLSLSADAGLPRRGAWWRWQDGDSRVTAWWSWDADDARVAADAPVGLVQAVTASEEGMAWAGVRVDKASEPSQADQGPPAWVLGAGWGGRVGGERAVAEFVEGPMGGGWGLSVLGEDLAVTLRRLRGAAARQLAGEGAGPLLAAKGELTHLEGRMTPATTGALVRSVGLGARLGSGAELYALTELGWPRLPGPSPAGPLEEAEGAALVETRVGAVVTEGGKSGAGGPSRGAGHGRPMGSPSVYPYLQATLTAPHVRAGAVQGTAGVTLRAGDRRLAGLHPWKAWTDLTMQLGDGLEAGLKASVKPEADSAVVRLQGDVRPSGGPVRLSSRAVAGGPSGGVAWEEVAIVYERQATRAELRLKPDRLEAQASVAHPAGGQAGSGGEGGGGSRWRLSGAVRWSLGSAASTRRVVLSGSWARGLATAAAQLDLDGAAHELSASVWLGRPEVQAGLPGAGAGLYGALWWRGVPAAAPVARVDTVQLRLGARRAVGPRWGWFAEGEHHLVVAGPGLLPDGPAYPVFRGMAAAAGVYLPLPGDAGGALVEAGWRVASYGLPGSVVEHLAPSLRPGWFVRLSGWWTALPAAATICRDS